jgi:DNA-binding response OmpR family regulator
MSEEALKARILVAEDEELLRNLIALQLESVGYEVVVAADGIEALKKYYNKGPWDLIVLDIMMPQLDGFSVLQNIRETSEVPVVFLTALGSGDDLVRGFNLGADDYITKPFTFREVTVRIEAILRRVAWMQNSAPDPIIYTNGDIQLDTKLRQVIVKGKDRHVSPIEYGLLYYFMTHIGAATEKEELFREVWGYEFQGSTNLVEVGVRRLREKIEDDPSKPRYIRTIRGVGYRFCHVEPG